MKPASTRLSSTTLARARAAGRLMCGAYLVGALNRPGEHRGFRQIDVARRLVEIEMRGAVDAEGAAAHIGAIEIEFQNFILGEPRLQPDRQEASFTLRSMVRSLFRKRFFANCWVIDEPPCLTPPACAFVISARAVPATSMPKWS
jgi:hypothetical protein